MSFRCYYSLFAISLIIGLHLANSAAINNQDTIGFDNGNRLRSLLYPIYKRTTTEERTAPLFQYLSSIRSDPENNHLSADKSDNRSARKKRSLFGMGYSYGMPYGYGSYGYGYPYGYGNSYLGNYGYGYGYGGGYGGGYGYDPYCNW